MRYNESQLVCLASLVSLFNLTEYLELFSACSGIVLTSYSKYEPIMTQFERRMAKSIKEYLRYKKITGFNGKYKGKTYLI